MKSIAIIILICISFCAHAQQNTKQPNLGNSETIQSDTLKINKPTESNSTPKLQFSEPKNQQSTDTTTLNQPVLINSSKKEE